MVEFLEQPFSFTIIGVRIDTSVNPAVRTDLEVYSGVCDIEVVNKATIKGGALNADYRVYILDRIVACEKGDKLTMTMPDGNRFGEVMQSFPGQLGTEIQVKETL